MPRSAGGARAAKLASLLIPGKNQVLGANIFDILVELTILLKRTRRGLVHPYKRPRNEAIAIV
ncbi:MAG: hypothetical protein KDK23_13105 [Leptospiraceae bacterium]|nr:hypothetical protein [Leptospiraceae bacterium]MCB1167521.1 hypothetical protein [Leptospiraceae bacterium]